MHLSISTNYVLKKNNWKLHRKWSQYLCYECMLHAEHVIKIGPFCDRFFHLPDQNLVRTNVISIHKHRQDILVFISPLFVLTGLWTNLMGRAWVIEKTTYLVNVYIYYCAVSSMSLIHRGYMQFFTWITDWLVITLIMRSMPESRVKSMETNPYTGRTSMLYVIVL